MNTNSYPVRAGLRPNRGRRGNVDRRVHAILRNAHLTGAPGWYEYQSRHVDPPPYTADQTWSRSVRVVTLVTSGAVIFTSQTIADALGPTVNYFDNICILQVNAYGPATQGGFVALKFAANTTRTFVDYGTQGSLRPHVSVAISPRDQSYQTFPGAFEHFTLFSTDDAEVIVDLNVLLRRAATPLPFLSNPSGVTQPSHHRMVHRFDMPNVM